MATQLTIDSYIVSSTVIETPKRAPTQTALIPARTVRYELYSYERVAQMFKRKMPLPSAIWDTIKSVVFVAFVRAPLIELAVELQKTYPSLPAFTSWRNLHEGQIEIELTMIQLLRIVGLAKQKRILQ